MSDTEETVRKSLFPSQALANAIITIMGYHQEFDFILKRSILKLHVNQVPTPNSVLGTREEREDSKYIFMPNIIFSMNKALVI